MRILSHKDPGFERELQNLQASSSLLDPEIERKTREILEAVRSRGDDAILEFMRKFDGATLTAEQLAVTQAELMTAALAAGKTLRAAVAEASRNIAGFARRSRRRNWQARNSHGAVVGEKFDPFERVGIYIPGGSAPLISTALMTIVLARVAGCPQIVVCTPCNSEGTINPALLYAARTAGATEIYRIGGAQAIAAMTYGTGTVKPVQKIFGPGNAYVVAAKRLVFGHVAIDLLPGPSEVMVLADHTAQAACVAADLLAQAEHGSGHERVWLATPDMQLLKRVVKEIDRQLPGLARRELIERVLKNNACLVHVSTMEDGIALANLLAPEHCEIMARNARKYANGITRAGAIFLGRFSPTVLGDYVAGPSHTLPTGGAGSSFAGLTVDQFQRRTSLVEYDRSSLKRALPAVRTFAEVEGLGAHGASATVRF